MIKFTKTELRNQQWKLGQLQKYLPTLQLKKMLLQTEVNQAEAEIEQLSAQFEVVKDLISEYARLFSDKNAFDLFPSVKVAKTVVQHENIAGVDIPILEEVIFQEADYFLFETPVWLEAAISRIKELITFREKIKIASQKKQALEKELKEVSIRVNLFEKILIPRAQGNIKKIKIFLGDMELSAVCQAKVSKSKIVKKEVLTA